MSTNDMPPAASRPDRIGGYRILGQLGGRSTHSVVFEAEQETPRRAAAIRVFSSGSDRVCIGFDAIASALRASAHSNLIAVHETATVDLGAGPQPFIVMEFMRGRTILEHARSQRLETSERVAQMGVVCDAVQHAHQHGVLHRGLCPANVRVNERGEVRVLDLGLAALTNSDLAMTSTPEATGADIAYLSPEQRSGDEDTVDARSDVYALGVMLYELLAGRLPHDVGHLNAAAAQEVLDGDEEVTPLSTVNRMLRGDLETIVHRAIERDPVKRYQSAGALAADLRRYLADEPIDARPVGAAREVRKFAARNKTVAVGVTSAFALLLAVTGLMGVRSVSLASAVDVAEGAARRDTIRAERAEQLAAIFGRMLDAIEPARDMGADPTLVLQMLDATAPTVEQDLQDRPELRATVAMRLGNAYAALDAPARAAQHLGLALELREQILGADHPETIDVQHDLARLHLDEGRASDAEAMLITVLEHREETLGGAHRGTMQATLDLARARLQLRRTAEATSAAQKLLATAPETFGSSDAIVLDARRLMAHLKALGGDRPAAIQQWRQIIETTQRSHGESDPRTIDVLCEAGAFFRFIAAFEDAAEWYTIAVERAERAFGPDHALTCRALAGAAEAYADFGRVDESIGLLRGLLSARRASLGTAHADTIESQLRLARVLSGARRIEEAEPLLRDALTMLTSRHERTYPTTIKALEDLADLCRRAERYEDAEQLALDAFERLEADPHVTPDRMRICMHRILAIYQAWGRQDKMDEWRLRLESVKRVAHPGAEH